MPYLKYISDQNLIVAVGKVINVIMQTEKKSDESLFKNVLDPFSAIFQGISESLSYNDWLKRERIRQNQKTMQNAIGDFHQHILGSIPGWSNLGAGGGLDVINFNKRIIAEVKNKHNTTKGNHKTEIYDAINQALENTKHKAFVGYLVEIIPKNSRRYNIPFTPSDNKIKSKRPLNDRIRVIDGVSFYALASGRESALRELFEILPRVIEENYNLNLSNPKIQGYFSLFDKAFPK